MKESDFDTVSGDDALAVYLNDLDLLSVADLWDRLIGKNWSVAEFCEYAGRMSTTPRIALSAAIDRGPWAHLPDEIRSACFHRLRELLPADLITTEPRAAGRVRNE